VNNEQIFLSRQNCDAFAVLSITPEEQRSQKHHSGNQKYETWYSHNLTFFWPCIVI